MRVDQLVAGRYRLRQRVGSGAHGAVWRAVDERLRRTVALKHALSEEGEGGTGRIAALKREARMLAQLNHPNIVTVFDVVPEDGEWWLVMEYVPGHSLRDLGALPPERAAHLGAQVAGALEAVHAAGVVHRDIKPSNVLVTDNDRAKLGDFGISRTVYADETLTGTGSFAGTLGYMAPEMAAEQGEPTASSDVFSLGATLFATVEGKPPFGDSGHPASILRRTMDGDIDTPRRAGPLTPLLTDMLRTSPSKRPTAGQVRERLEDLATLPTTASRHPKTSGNTRWARLSGRTRWATATAALILLLTLLVWITNARPFTPTRTSDVPQHLSVIGDVHSADPCALADPQTVAQFDGSSRQDPEAGDFNRCDILLHPGGGVVNIAFSLENPTPETPTGSIEQTGPFGLLRAAAHADRCFRIVLLPDRFQIGVEAKKFRDGQFDLCAIADAAAAGAVDVAARGTLPRRSALRPTASLFHADACNLLNPEGLSQYPGVNAKEPEIGFGNWECRWRSTTAPGYLRIGFDRRDPMTAGDGQPITLPGHTGYLQLDATEDTCRVGIVHREYVSSDSTRKVEVVQVVVQGPQAPERRCQLATSLATSVAAAMPPP
ncbi:serine/threonine-protein kinase [Nocardia sp. NPDC051030]|uniref:serine/threonine-protein kinase n=1 Tax=Nocardia sp. NPDC051030 TaxID=3155162 RepID=UPI003442BF23